MPRISHPPQGLWALSHLILVVVMLGSVIPFYSVYSEDFREMTGPGSTGG